MDPLSGSSAAASFPNGNPIALSCGSMASVGSFQSAPVSVLMIIHILSWLREEHPLVSRRSNVHLSETSLPCRVALPSFGTYKHHAKRDQGLSLTSISTSGTSKSKIVETSSHLFSFNFPLSPVLVATFFTDFIWSMKRVLRSPPKLH